MQLFDGPTNATETGGVRARTGDRKEVPEP